MIKEIFFYEKSIRSSLHSGPAPTALYSLKELRKKGIRTWLLAKNKKLEIEDFFEEVIYPSQGICLEQKLKDIIKAKKLDEASYLLFKEDNKDLVYQELVEKGLIAPAELSDALDKDGKPLGFFLVRKFPKPPGSYSLVVEILVEHLDDSILLVRRDLSKDREGGSWEASAAGSVQAGEEPLQAAKREVFEETGIDRGHFKLLGSQIIEEVACIWQTYHCLTDFDKEKISLNPGETMDYRWIEKKKLPAFLASDQAIGWQHQRYKNLGII